jgi:vancomycin permeability regulator SanA
MMEKKASNRYLENTMTARGTRRRRKRRARAVALLAALALCGGFAALGVNVVMARGAAPRILDMEAAAALEDVDCILVLGAQVLPGGTPSHMLEDRVRRGVELFEAGAAPALLMSGDHGRVQYDEVTAMKQQAVNAGVPSAKIFMDHAGFSTYDSLYRAREVFEAKRVLVVTQRYHMFRALYIARRLGLEAWGVSSDYRGYATQFYCSAREAAARCKDFGKCLLRPEPQFLGPVIPLTVSGDVTNDEGIDFQPQKG